MSANWSCPYKCLNCLPEMHPELVKEQNDEERPMVIMDVSEDEEENYPVVGTGQSYLDRLEKPKEKKKKPPHFRQEAFLEPDLPAFDFLASQEPRGLRRRIDYSDEGYIDEHDEPGTSSELAKKNKGPKRVNRQAMPICDYSKSLSHWMKPETLVEVYKHFGMPQGPISARK